MRKTIVLILATIATMSVMLTANAAPALAQIKGNCTGITCIAADVYTNFPFTNRFVQDATVSVTDGIPRRLEIFIAGDSWKSPTPVLQFKREPRKYYPDNTLVCGRFVGSSQPACFPL